MCGIAGYSVHPESRLDRRLAAQALLAAIAERGADAVGYAHRTGDGPVVVHKQRTGASKLIEQLEVPPATTEALIHVRDYTKGTPTVAANNHPIRQGAVVGIHNGIIVNDDDIFAEHGLERAEPEMTVDSAAIFALADSFGPRREAFEALRGSMATAWLDERREGALFLARGVGRPLWLGVGPAGVFFASTRYALEIVERYARVRLVMHEVGEGSLVGLAYGRVAWTERFELDRGFEERTLPAVRSPREGASCLARLAALAAL